MNLKQFEMKLLLLGFSKQEYHAGMDYDWFVFPVKSSFIRVGLHRKLTAVIFNGKYYHSAILRRAMKDIIKLMDIYE